jgi:hypothetical protein
MAVLQQEAVAASKSILYGFSFFTFKKWVDGRFLPTVRCIYIYIYMCVCVCVLLFRVLVNHLLLKHTWKQNVFAVTFSDSQFIAGTKCNRRAFPKMLFVRSCRAVRLNQVPFFPTLFVLRAMKRSSVNNEPWRMYKELVVNTLFIYLKLNELHNIRGNWRIRFIFWKLYMRCCEPIV